MPFPLIGRERRVFTQITREGDDIWPQIQPEFIHSTCLPIDKCLLKKPWDSFCLWGSSVDRGRSEPIPLDWNTFWNLWYVLRVGYRIHVLINACWKNNEIPSNLGRIIRTVINLNWYTWIAIPSWNLQCFLCFAFFVLFSTNSFATYCLYYGCRQHVIASWMDEWMLRQLFTKAQERKKYIQTI